MGACLRVVIVGPAAIDVLVVQDVYKRQVLPVRVNGKMTRMKTLPLKPGAEAPQAAAR